MRRQKNWPRGTVMDLLGSKPAVYLPLQSVKKMQITVFSKNTNDAGVQSRIFGTFETLVWRVVGSLQVLGLPRGQLWDCCLSTTPCLHNCMSRPCRGPCIYILDGRGGGGIFPLPVMSLWCRMDLEIQHFLCGLSYTIRDKGAHFWGDLVFRWMRLWQRFRGAK